VDVRLHYWNPESNSKCYRVSRDHQRDCGPLSGLCFGPIDGAVDWGLDVVSCEETVEKLIEIDGRGLLTRICGPSHQILISTTTEIMDLRQAVSKNIDFRTCFSQVAPLLIGLRSIFREFCWVPRAAHANIIIDDPPLWPRYGHLDLKRLIETVDRLGCGCTIGMIPWNYRRSNPRIAGVLASRATRIGICYHGCNHTRAEFGLRDGAAVRRLLATAQQRMRQHEQRTGLRCQSVMVFPQGIFSVDAMQALKATRFLAVANTEIQDRQHQLRVTTADLLRPALECYGNFPLFARRNPHEGPVNFGMDLFLGKPCLIVLHHDFFKPGFPAFEELVRTISSLDQDLTWENLENIVSACSLWQVNDGGAQTAMVFANETHLQLDAHNQSAVAVIKPHAEDDKPLRVEVDGEPCDFTAEGGYLKFSLPSKNRSRVCVSIIAAQEPFLSPAHEDLRSKVRVAARRYASEFRDNHLAAVETSRRCARLLARLIRRRGRGRFRGN
jgi:hypothetical protein